MPSDNVNQACGIPVMGPVGEESPLSPISDTPNTNYQFEVPVSLDDINMLSTAQNNCYEETPAIQNHQVSFYLFFFLNNLI